MGSVKDIWVLKEPSSESLGIARFSFSDRYSVFDWGEMPNHIPNKGASIALLSSYFFEKLEEMGILTHYEGMVEDGEVKKLHQLKFPSNIMEIKLLRVIKPNFSDGKYDYTPYQKNQGNFLIPLEVIYRNFLPGGSSIFKRLKEGKIMPSDLGLNEMPRPGQKLDIPILEVSTKLEITDRYISWKEAQDICNLDNQELEEIKNIAYKINNLISNEFAKIGLINEDGKLEFGFSPTRCLMLVDVLGTLDECRFTFDGIPVSKEIARIYYRKIGWEKQVEEAKKKSLENWKKICPEPPPLPSNLVELISQAYCACTNEITGRIWFPNIPPISDILKGLQRGLSTVGSAHPSHG